MDTGEIVSQRAVVNLRIDQYISAKTNTHHNVQRGTVVCVYTDAKKVVVEELYKTGDKNIKPDAHVKGSLAVVASTMRLEFPPVKRRLNRSVFIPLTFQGVEMVDTRFIYNKDSLAPGDTVRLAHHKGNIVLGEAYTSFTAGDQYAEVRVRHTPYLEIFNSP